MIVYKQADSLKELEQILALQQRNLPKNISQEESTKEGFVTVEHSLETLKSMNDVCGHIIAMDDGQVVGYALCMHPKFSGDIEVLRPMFMEIETALNDDVRYMVMGANLRGQKSSEPRYLPKTVSNHEGETTHGVRYHCYRSGWKE